MKCLPLFCTALAFTFAVTSGCKKQDEDTPATAKDNSNEVVASVDGVKYLRKDLDKNADILLTANRVPENQWEQYRPMAEQQVILQFVRTTLLKNEAQKIGLVVTDEDRKAMEARFDKRLQAESNISLEEYFKTSPLGEEAARKEFADNVLLEKLIQEKIVSTIVVSEEEVAKMFEDIRQRIAQAEAENKAAAESKTTQRTKIEALKKQLADGADFAALAKEHSDCPSGQEGGALGTFQRGQMVKEFEDAAFSQEIGKIGDIVETRFGYHLVLVTAKNPAVAATAGTPATPETVAASHILLKVDSEKQIQPPPSVEEVQDYLKNKKTREALGPYLKELQAKAKVTAIVDIEDQR